MAEIDMVNTLDSTDDDGDDDAGDAQSKSGLSQSTASPTSTSASQAKKNRARLTFPFGACRVCSDSATGIHYGIATCEGCKGFFKRSILRKEKYRCYFDNACHINVTNRNRCKACRFRRCLDEGMSVDGVKMGRIPKLVKERALREQREQQLKEEAERTATSDRTGEVHAREASCSSTSDGSIENYDPDTMPAEMQKLSMSAARSSTDPAKTHAHYGPASSGDRSMKCSTMDANVPEQHSNASSSRSTLPSSSNANHAIVLPVDFTIDETDGLIEHICKPLDEGSFGYVASVSKKIAESHSLTTIKLTDEESKFIGYLRWSAYNTHVRHSRRVKQLETRMAQLAHAGIADLDDSNATLEQFMAGLPKIVEIIVRGAVFCVQELPGMTNIDSTNLHKMIHHRSFEWFLLKYKSLLNANGQCYFVSSDGFRFTRRWLHFFYTAEMTSDMFEFSLQFHQLNLTESEMALILPMQICYPDPTIDNQDIPRMLRACYIYALYAELCHNRGEQEARIMCSKILLVLDLLIPLNAQYEKNVASRLLQVLA